MDTNSSICCCSYPHYESCLCGTCIVELCSTREGLSAHSNDQTEPLVKDNGPHKSSRKCWGKVYPSESSSGNLEPPSPSFSGEGAGVHFPIPIRSNDTSPSNQLSLVSADYSPFRSDGDEEEELTSSFFSVPDELYSDTTSGLHVHYGGVEQYVQMEPDRADEGILGTENISGLTISHQKSEKLPKPLNFETDGLIWSPPPPEDVNDEMEGNLFTYYDDEEVEISGDIYLPTADADKIAPANDLDCKEPLKAPVLGHFRTLVSQLLLTEHVASTEDSPSGDWSEVIAAIAWQAAKYIKPDTSRGGSMDPCDYLKIKCVASGCPGQSKLVKGIVCTKNINHKRMLSQYKNAKLLILGGALEYQRAFRMLASVHTLIEQEHDHLKTVVSKIEAHRPNVLLVENTVSSYALEQLFAKEISVVLNVKGPLLERIARCTGASIIPSTEHISVARLGHCGLFHLEKVSEEHEPLDQFNRMSSKTLMFFEGCPRRAGCTIVLRGSSREELKKVKNVMQYAVFAAYHLSLETSFLADEGTMTMCSTPADSESTACFEANFSSIDSGQGDGLGLEDSLSKLRSCDYFSVSDVPGPGNELSQECEDSHAPLDLDDVWSGVHGFQKDPIVEPLSKGEELLVEAAVSSPVEADDAVISDEHCLDSDNYQSILVSFFSHCIVNGVACEKTRLLRVKFYGPSDKPLGRYLRDDLFDQMYRCKTCHEPAEAHVICYTHQNANLTIRVRNLPTVALPGVQDGKIWMWHRCLKCENIGGVPPATRRVVMSDAAWGLSFGKFLELSFYNHVTGNRVSACGHSLQRDCLRFFGFGSMIASFQYSHIDILSIHLPPPVLEFNHTVEESWIRKESHELFDKAEALYADISSVLEAFKVNILFDIDGFHDASKLQNHFTELNDILVKDKSHYKDLLQLANKEFQKIDEVTSDIAEINRLRDYLSISLQSWVRRLYLLEAFLKRNSGPEARSDDDADNLSLDLVFQDITSGPLKPVDFLNGLEKMNSDGEDGFNTRPPDRLPSAASMLLNSIDSAWSGVGLALVEDEGLDDSSISGTGPLAKANQKENPSIRKLMGTKRIYSFDSDQSSQETVSKGLPLYHASGDCRSLGTFLSRGEAVKRDLYSSAEPGARTLDPQNGQDDTAVVIHDIEPTSIIAYALRSKEYEDWTFSWGEGISNVGLLKKLDSLIPDLSPWQSFSSFDTDYMKYQHVISLDQEGSPHVQISFEDESCKTVERVKYSVTCYFAREFDALRRKCCPSETDFIHSLGRCRKWCAQGGKSNVYFAKSLDERFIIKQLTKTELQSFKEFGATYFKYMTDALSSQDATCLAKVLGVYQVSVKRIRGAKEVKKMDLMVMENLFFKRSISKVYDLKGSLRSRYISDTTGTNKVLLDMNLLETVGRNPIFVGSKAKRNLMRAVWNDTAFLASVDVMDYSLLVGVDEERKELVMGIIDFMRQYTWDKQLETWVKASGILGGPKSASPTIISPKEYKKRFRKAMTSYFLTVPDQWSS